jgi:MFS family permease
MVAATTLSALLYLFQCAIGGFITIFMPIFFSQVGLGDFEISIINALSPVAGMLGSPLWGALADSGKGRRKKIMIGLSLASLMSAVALVPIGLLAPAGTQFALTLFVCCVSTFAGGSIGSLLDGIVVEQVPKNAYGKLRLWCAVGYGSASGTVGLAMLYVDSTIKWLPYVTHFAPGVLCALVSMGMMFFLEDSPSRGTHPDETFPSIQDEQTRLKEPDTEEISFLEKLKKVPRTLDMFLFIIVIFICGCCMGLVGTFLFLFIEKALNGTQLVMGVSVLVTCAFEVPVFFSSEYVLNRMSPDWALVISLIAYILRFGLYWLLSVFQWNAWFILLPEMLHGFTFALMWCSAVAKATKTISGLNLTNFAVGFISAVLTSGNVAGTLAVGALLNHGVSYVWVWQGGTYVMAAVTVIWIIKVTYSSHTKKLQKS